VTGPVFVQPLLVLEEVDLVQITVELIDARVGLPLRRKICFAPMEGAIVGAMAPNDADFQCCA
jgi:hypothetical protein